METVKKQMTELEKTLMKTLFIQQNTEIGLQSLQNEMKDFKDEMRIDRINLNKKWGELANKMGTVIEDIISPNIPTIVKKYFNCEFIDHLMVRNYKRTPDKKKGKEFDLLAVCGDLIFWNNTKSTPTVQYINEFIEEIKNEVLFEYYPEYSNLKIIPIFSGLSIREDLVKFLTRNKIFALAMTGNTMDLLNANELLEKQ